MLNLKLRKDSRGNWWVDWTSDPKASSYEIITPTGTHVQAGKSATSSKLGKPTEPFTVQVAPAYAQTFESVSQPPVVTPPPIDPPPVITPPPSGTSYDSITNWDDPFTAVRTLTFTDKAGLLNLLSARQPGDLIRYAGSSNLMIDTSGDSFRGFAVRSPGDVRVELGHPNDPHVGFRYTGTAQYSAVFLGGASHIQIRGGEVSTPNGGGSGIMVMGGYTTITDHVSWEDFLAHDCGCDGIDLFPTNPGGGDTSEISDFSFKGVVKNIAQNPAWDPHIDKKTGLHCCNSMDVHSSTTGRSGRMLRGRLAIDGYDCLCGSVIELGAPSGEAAFQDVTYYFRGTRLKLAPTSQTAGNGLQFWGGVPINLTVAWAELIDSTGAVIHGYGTKGSGWDSGKIVVQHGRHQNTNQYVGHDNTAEPYDSRFSIVYQDCV